MQNLHYNLNDLFDNTPVFPEPIISYSNAEVDPADDAYLMTKMMRAGADCKEFNAKVERLNEEKRQKAES